jgi:hypothetical protein
MAHWSLVSQQLSSANLIPYEDKDHVITPINICRDMALRLKIVYGTFSGVQDAWNEGAS